MSAYSWWRMLRVPVAAGLVTALTVAAAIVGYAATRPVRYQSRFTLVATPSAQAQPGGADLGSLVSITVPSLTELARSPSILHRVIDGISGAPDVSLLATRITVEVVPASGVARISVEDGNAARASRLASALSHQIRALKLLSPVGEFRSFGSDSDVRKTSPDLVLGLGFGLAAGLLSGLVVAGLWTVRRPRVIGRRQVATLVDDRDVPVVTIRSLSGPGELARAVLDRASTRLVGVGDVASEMVKRAEKSRAGEGDVHRIAHGLRAQLPGSVPAGFGVDTVLVVALGATTPDELSNSYAMVRSSRSRVVAVVLVSLLRTL